MNYVLYEVQMPTWEGAISRGNRQTIVKYRDNPRLSVQTCTAEPTEVPFGLWVRLGPRHYVLHAGPDPPFEGAILVDRGPPTS